MSADQTRLGLEANGQRAPRVIQALPGPGRAARNGTDRDRPGSSERTWSRRIDDREWRRLEAIADDQIIGISKLTRVVRLFARRFTVQERIGEQVCDALVAMLAPRGVAVRLEAEHTRASSCVASAKTARRP